MELSVFKGQKREELSMIEVAHALLEQKDEVMEFAELVNEIQDYLVKSDVDIRQQLSQFYTDLNIDGSFIFLGENRVGLRSWYAIDEIDEELTNVLDDDEKGTRRKKKKRVNAFVSIDDEDAIDWNNDDSEDEDFSDDLDDDLSIDDDEDDEEDEAVAYDNNLSEVNVNKED
ncbi:MAG: DNA-directed RNA polymerase subunit delta [Lactobacillales bacterium]|nr:DNA-directed RNA polymerase subunit delta [Lactobacillales bacterium]